MPNRQHSRSPAGGRSPAGSRNPAGSRSSAGVRPPRTVPVSRYTADSRFPQEGWSAPQPGAPIYTEPEVRRWPHPVEEAGAAPGPEPALHYIRCALSYQNQLLADIKALLEQLALAASAAETPAAAPQEKG